jgi:predicted acylesterase/phospholipase RssA
VTGDLGTLSGLKLKGVAGSSAGAVTAFPLALGLTSKDINTILTSFHFSKELLQNHKLNEGKYRMVGMGRDGKAKILVAEDHFRKMGEDRLANYDFTLPPPKQAPRSLGGKVVNSVVSIPRKDQVGSNVLKTLVRSYIVATALSVIFTGLNQNWPITRKMVAAIRKFIDQYKELKQLGAWFKGDVVEELYTRLFGDSRLGNLATGAAMDVTPTAWNLLLKNTLMRYVKLLNRLPWGSKYQSKFFGVLPRDNIVGAIGNIIWDRGIYAGFEVRELFFKILLLALLKDTHFRRGLLKREGLLRDLSLTREAIENLTISFDDNFEVEADDKNRLVLVKLARLPELLTFRELYEILQLNVVFCVTNATTSQPVYFSHYFTPDFPVLEAVGSSMNFPLAFKPTYNEANVLLDQGMFLNPSDFVTFTSHKPFPLVYKEKFAMRTYNEHLGVLLAYVKKHSDLSMSVNGNLSFRSFLPYLREIIKNERYEQFEVTNAANTKTRNYDAKYIKSLCYFYYNSAFKGILMDGGVTNNLPISVFTFLTEKVDSSHVQSLTLKQSVLALKLDNSFPEGMRTEAYSVLEKGDKGALLEKLQLNPGDEAAHLSFIARLRKKSAFKKALDEKLDLSKVLLLKLSRELIDEYRLSLRGFTPWNKQAFLLFSVGTSLQFGMDQGQIENIGDNENIVPLYCYGLTTLEFDLTSDEIKPLVEFAVDEAEKQVAESFIASPKH